MSKQVNDDQNERGRGVAMATQEREGWGMER